MDVDIIIIGAGLGGTSSAIVLAKAGYDVALVDSHATYPPEFRAEKIGAPHMAKIESLGLADTVLAHVDRLDDIWVARYGRVVAKVAGPDYAFHYADLVNGLRADLPATVRFVLGRVADIATGDERQCVTMADGTVLRARLIIVATGLGDSIRSRVSIERVRISRAHSLSLGFDLTVRPHDLPFASLVYYGNGPRDRLAYFTLFPIGDAARVNLYVYRTVGEEWTKQFRQNPNEVLRTMMPGLEHIMPKPIVQGPIAMRSIDLTVTENYRRPGVVLIGDAFATCCPVPGVGIQKVFTDVEQLTKHHIPAWFGSPGMGADKIGTYYDDPVKLECDARGLAASRYARSLATSPSIRWVARRLRNQVVRRGLHAVQDAGRLFGGRSILASHPRRGGPF